MCLQNASAGLLLVIAPLPVALTISQARSPPMPRLSPRASFRPAMAALALASAAGLARAGDVTWDNGSSNFLWDTASLNWNGVAWSNAPGDGAVFTGFGTGTISLPGPVTVRSMDFQTPGYTLAGPGPLSFTTGGAGTLPAGVVSVAGLSMATFNAPVSTATVLQKRGDGVL